MKPEERRRQAFDKRAIYPGWRGGKPLTIQGGYCCPCNQHNYTVAGVKCTVGKDDRWIGTPGLNGTPYTSFAYTSTNEQRLFIAFGKDSAGNAEAIDFSSVKEIWLNLGHASKITAQLHWTGISPGRLSGFEGVWAPLWIFAYAITSTWAVPASGSANQILWANQPSNTWKSNSNSFTNPATTNIDNYVASIRLGSTALLPSEGTITTEYEEEVITLEQELKSASSSCAFNSLYAHPNGTYKGDYAVADVREQIVRMEVSPNAPLTNPIYGLMLIPFTLYDLYTYDGGVWDTTHPAFLLDYIPGSTFNRAYSTYEDVDIENCAVTYSPAGFPTVNSDFPFDYSLIPSGGTIYQDRQYATMGYNITNDKALLLIPASC